MNKNIPKIYSVFPGNLKGKCAVFPNLIKNTKDEDPYVSSDLIAHQYEKYIRLNKLNKTLEYNFPQHYSRLSERQKPCQIRREKKEDQIRIKDRADVRFLCEWFMWSQAAYKPPVKKKK